MSDSTGNAIRRIAREPDAFFEGPAFDWLQNNGYKELGQPIHYEHAGHTGYHYPHEILAAYAAEVRAATEKLVREECAKAVCWYCANGYPLKQEGNRWRHLDSVTGEVVTRCHAASIRSLEIKGE